VTAAVSIKGASKRFGATLAVNGLDLEVPRGSVCGFLGPNGAGKTTTIRMIMSIIYPDAGSIEVLGGSALARKDSIGYLPEERGVYRKMRAGEFLHYMARLKGVGAQGLKQRIEQALERLELPGVYGRRCQELSKGMQQKVQFIAAILHKPELLILDEPFSGLDPVNTQVLSSVIDELHRSGTTIIFSTHVLAQAEQICDRIFLIHRGVKRLDATMDEIHQRFNPRAVLAEPLDGPRIEIQLEDGADPQEVMRRLLADRPMRRVELRRLSLTEVFVDLVNRDEGAAAAAAAREELEQ
jgi:ABC-2 type transport system ATP-binding protein